MKKLLTISIVLNIFFLTLALIPKSELPISFCDHSELQLTNELLQRRLFDIDIYGSKVNPVDSAFAVKRLWELDSVLFKTPFTKEQIKAMGDFLIEHPEQADTLRALLESMQ